MQEYSRSAGVILMVVSALVFSTAGLFTKGVEAGAWDVVFWRGLFAAILTTAYVAWRGTLREDFLQMGLSGWAVAIVGASGSAAFISAFKLTSIANVTLIYAGAPLLAALMAFFWMGERLSRAVGIGCVTALAGVAVIVSGSLGGVNLQGDFLAIWMAIAVALMLVIYRRFPGTPGGGPMVLSSLLLLPFGLYFGDPLHNLPGEIAILAAFGLIFAVASVTMVEGAKRLPSGETALLSTLDAPLAPLFAWMMFSQVPPILTVLGGVLVLAGIVVSQSHEFLQERLKRREFACPVQSD